MLNHSSQFEENVLSQTQRRSSKKNSRNMKAYEKKRFESGSQEIKQFMIIDSVSPPTRSFQDPLASCFTDSPLKTSDLLDSNFNFSHYTPSKHDYLLQETLPTNDKDRLLRDILVKLNTYKRLWNNTKGIVSSSDPKFHPFYYDYLNEKDDFTLKVLIRILYEEIENLSDFLEQNSLSQKEDYAKMQQRLREKDSLCTSIVKETLEQKSTIAQYRAKIEESDKKSSGYINCISDLQRVLQTIFEDIFCSKFELGSEKKLEIGNLIKNALNNIPYFIQESTIDRTRRESSDQRKSEQSHFSPRSVKRELTYSDLMDVMNKDLNISPPNAAENTSQIKNSPKADLRQLLFDNRFSSPKSSGRQDEDDFEFKKHRRSFSFNKNSFASANISPNRGNQKISEELANMNNQLIRKTKDLEESLNQANKTIASLLEEKNSFEPIVKQLRIQKDELAIKLQACDMRPTNNTNLEERLATFMSEGPKDELSKSLNFPDTHSIKEDLKAVFKVMKEAEEKIIALNERTSYQTNFSYDHERPNSLKNLNTASLSKIREGSDFSEEGKGSFDHHLGGDVLEMLQNKLKNSQEIHKMLIKQYENKVLDTIEKLEDMKGMCNLVMMTNQSMVRVNDDHTPTRIRALHTELERKNANIQEKIKRIEQDQEVNRLELEEMIRQEEFVEEFYKLDQRTAILNDGKPYQIKNENQLIAENHELNEMVQMLSQEVTSLKSQLKLQQTLVEHSPLFEPLSTRSTRRLSRDSSYHATLNEKQRINYNNLINQNDLYYMLNAQATSLEALLS